MMIYFVDHIVDPFRITQPFAHFRHSFQNIFVLARTYTPKRICAISLIGIDNIIEKWLQTMSDLKYEPEFSYSILQGEAVFKIFETADNNLMMSILITETDQQTMLICQRYVCGPQHATTRSTAWANDIITSWWSRASWSKFYVLVQFLCAGVNFLGDIYYIE